MKRLFKFKYPKIAVLSIFIILSYYIFKNPDVSGFISSLGALSYLGTFIAGIFFAFGFSSPLSAGFFIVLNPSNLWLAGITGGLGALFGDLIIFNLIRFSFQGEFNRLKKSGIIRKFDGFVDYEIGKKIRIYLMYIFAGFLIASPLPDEIGIIMLAGLTRIKQKILAVLSFVLNSVGILILLNL